MVHSDFKEISRGRSKRSENLGIHIYKLYKLYKYQYLPATDVHPKKAGWKQHYLHMAESPSSARPGTALPYDLLFRCLDCHDIPIWSVISLSSPHF